MIDLVEGSGVRGSGRRNRPNPRATAARTWIALGLAWRAAPLTLLCAVLVELIGGIAPVASTWLIAAVVDGLTQTAGSPAAISPWWLGLGFASVTLLLTVGVPVQRYLMAELSRAVAIRAKDRLYKVVREFALLSVLEQPAFRDRLRLAEQACRSGPGQMVTSLLASGRAMVTLIGLLATVLAIMPVLGLAMCAAMVPALVAELRLSRERAAMMWRISPTERREFFYTELLTSLSAAKEIRLFGAGRVLHERMLTELSTANRDHRRHDRRELRTHGVLALLSGGLAGAALCVIVWSAARGSITPGEVGAAVVAIGTLLTATASLVAQLAAGHHAGLLLDHYRELIAMRVTPEPLEAATPSPDGGDIELVDVWFRYGPDQPWVLRGVNLTIRAGRAMALVGENGSGKSTLVKLLCRFYDPTRGAIRWGGVDLRDLPIDEVRRRIGAVFQDFMSYELTAKENIALGDVDERAELDLSPGRIAAAAERAGIADAFDKLPRGMDTMLSRTFVDHAGDDDATGVLLSGGQWQRLALARALLRGQRELLILDEPSSGLDAIAEHRIHTQLAAYRRGRTSVLVSHRLNTVRDADEIVVLASGQVIEQGTHQRLIATDGTYAQLFQTQAAGYAETSSVR